MGRLAKKKLIAVTPADIKAGARIMRAKGFKAHARFLERKFGIKERTRGRR